MEPVDISDAQAAYLTAAAASMAAAAAYDESDGDRELLTAYLEAKRATAVALGIFEYGSVGGVLVGIGQQLADAVDPADVDRLMRLAAERTPVASAAGMPQTEIARYLGIDRMTIREWLGMAR